MILPKKYIHQSGANKGKINQALLQTGNDKSTYAMGDKHPFVRGLYYYTNRKGKNPERWADYKTLQKKIKYNQDWQKENKELHKVIHKKWLDKNIDHKRAYDKSYSQSEQGRRKRREWEKRNKEIIRVKRKSWEAKNEEHLFISRKKYREENKNKVRALKKVHEAKRRSIKMKASTNLTYTEEQLIKQYYEHSTRIKNKLGIEFHVDHIVPLSLGGLHHPSNLQVVPARWNMRKNNMNTNLWLPNGL